MAAFSRISFDPSLETAPLATYPAYSSIPSAVVWVTANCLPSGDQIGNDTLPPSGSRTGFGSPPDGDRKLSPVTRVARTGPFVFGLIRRPASLSIGSARSAI